MYWLIGITFLFLLIYIFKLMTQSSEENLLHEYTVGVDRAISDYDKMVEWKRYNGWGTFEIKQNGTGTLYIDNEGTVASEPD